jgi:diadenylate cyclase
MGYSGSEAGLAEHVTPRGARLLHAVPRVPAAVADRVVDRFGNLQRILAATMAELDEVEGVGEARARALKENLRRMREQALLGWSPG